jgi:aminopeptidase-like protein
MTKARKSLTMRVFQCSGDISTDDARIDHNMVKILSVLDGQKSLASIAFASGMSMSDFQKTIKALIELDLIVPIEAG